MARPKLRVPEPDACDFGPSLAKIGGRVVPVLAEGQNIELVDRPDPDAPHRTVRGATRTDLLRRLLRQGAISDAQFDAAERLRTDHQIAEGVGYGRDYNASLMGTTDWHKRRIARLEAQTRCREAWLAIRGAENDAWIADVVRCAVLAGCALADYDSARRVKHGTGSARLKEGLDRLAKYYGIR